jgi:hypothetical protein
VLKKQNTKYLENKKHKNMNKILMKVDFTKLKVLVYNLMKLKIARVKLDIDRCRDLRIFI